MRILHILQASLVFATTTMASSSWIETAALEEYLTKSFPAQITNVKVGESTITITGNTGEHSDVFLADVPLEFAANAPERFSETLKITPASDGSFSLTVPRIHERDGMKHDRLLSRWEIVTQGDAPQALSSGRYADEIFHRTPAPAPAEARSKKGLGGWAAGRIPGELNELGITAVTVNMMIHSLVALEPGENRTPFYWQGKTYYAREDALADFDRTFLEAAENKALVSVILLVANPANTQDPVTQLLGHPDATKDGIFAMPNVISREGVSLYGAILNLISERWSRADGKYGRVHHWILHNEVDAGWVWTNAGEKSDVIYMDLYQRSCRMVHLISSQYDPASRPFVSLTHHWSDKGEPRWYGSKRLLELLVRQCRVEGDFPWALAYHPYPQDLTKPRTWEDEQATFTFDTKKITPKNIEALDAYMKLPELLHQGKIRPVHLSENGFNSPDYSEKSLEDQAAAMAFAWKKITPLESIRIWHYHNWIDNRGEGGLKIGLRKFPDDADEPLGKKPIWHLYQKLSTENEDDASAPYLKTIGIASWEKAIHTGPIR